MKITVWGARGSVPAPGPETIRYGGNTSCVQSTLDDGTAARPRRRHRHPQPRTGAATEAERIHILLTHLHLDHIQGLMFFAPCFRAGTELRDLGARRHPRLAPGPDRALHLGAAVARRGARAALRRVVPGRARAPSGRSGPPASAPASVAHRGPTLGYRITEGDTSLCYIPDHEPALGAPLADLEDEWISGFALAENASLLIHDCQYYGRRVPGAHRLGPLARARDTLAFARRVRAERLLLFHHDPMHEDDMLDHFVTEASEQWTALGGDAGALAIARERQRLEIASLTPVTRGVTPA